MSEHDGPEQLACGRSWTALLDQLTEHPAAPPDDDHQRQCPHCQAARAEVDRLQQSLATLVEEPVTTPPGLTDRVMQRVREAAGDHWYSRISGELGSTRVAARVIAVIARQAASRIPGVAVALGRTTEPLPAATNAAATEAHRGTGAAVGVIGGTAIVDLALAADYGTNLHRVAELVRRAVIQDTRDLAGLDVVQVNINIDDVRPL